ncbi:MAG: peptide ABC transporter substrate-binding protein [Oscillospiraceae bacterium]|nr:peptide ABC transporter substrate-binding protein [Oscillospiraceae bacterium]
MKRILSVICLLLFCFSLTACSGKSEGSLFKYDIDADPINLDPQSASDYNSLLVIQNMFEGLLTYTEDGKLTEGVATDWKKSDNGLEYTFTLRQDASWSNGMPVTAQDFVFAFRRLFSPDTNAPYASDFFCIKNGEAATKGKKRLTDIGVKADNDYQLTFTLHTPNAMFLQLLTTAAAMPCNEQFFYQTKGKYGLEAKAVVDGETVFLILGNGPLYLKQWDHDDFLALRRNPYYGGAREAVSAGVNFLVFQPSDEEETLTFEEYRISRFADEQTDAVQLSGSNGNLLEPEQYQANQYESTTWGILFNQKHPILSNWNIRKALFLLDDSERYQQALPEHTELTQAIVPGVISVLDQNFREYAGQNIMPAYHAKKAKEYYQKGLQQLGIKSIEDVVLYAIEGSGQEELFGYLSQIWQRELGFYTTVKTVSKAEWNTALKSGEYGMAFYPLSGSYNSPDSILNSFLSNSVTNYSGYNSKSYQTYLSNGLKAFDLAKSAENFKKAEQLLIQDGVYFPMYSEHEFFVTQKGVSGILYNPQSKMAIFAYAEK